MIRALRNDIHSLATALHQVRMHAQSYTCAAAPFCNLLLLLLLLICCWPVCLQCKIGSHTTS